MEELMKSIYTWRQKQGHASYNSQVTYRRVIKNVWKFLYQFSRGCSMRLQRGSLMLFQKPCVSLKCTNSKVPAVPKAESSFSSVTSGKNSTSVLNAFYFKNNRSVNMYWRCTKSHIWTVDQNIWLCSDLFYITPQRSLNINKCIPVCSAGGGKGDS